MALDSDYERAVAALKSIGMTLREGVSTRSKPGRMEPEDAIEEALEEIRMAARALRKRL